MFFSRWKGASSGPCLRHILDMAIPTGAVPLLRRKEHSFFSPVIGSFCFSSLGLASWHYFYTLHMF